MKPLAPWIKKIFLLIFIYSSFFCVFGQYDDSFIKGDFRACTINAGEGDTICIGESTQLNASGSQNGAYTWTPTTGLSNPDIANPIAIPNTTTTYTVSNYPPGTELIVNGDFEAGNSGFTGDYTYVTPSYNALWPEATYTVHTSTSYNHSNWVDCVDHTYGNGAGNMLIVNGAMNPSIDVYCTTVNVSPNTNYMFSAWVMHVCCEYGTEADLQFSINGVLLGSQFSPTGGSCVWQQFFQTWNSGANTTAEICIVNQCLFEAGNDFAIDDISFVEICEDEVTVVVVPCDCETPPVPFAIEQPLCCGDNAVINYTGPGLGTISGVDLIDPTYSWSIGAATLVSGTLTGSGVPGIIEVSLPSCDESYDIMLTVINHEGGMECTPSEHTETIYVPSELTTGISGTNISCFGGSDGNISVTASGGTGGYDYNWIPVQPNSGNLNGIPAGTYYVTVTDENNCPASTSYTISQPTQINTNTNATDVSCYGGFDGTGAVTVDGGTPPYEYHWDDVGTHTTQVVDSLYALLYNVTVTDNNGCTVTDYVIVQEPPPVVIDLEESTNVSCYGYFDGTATVEASGGTGILSYSIPGITNQSGIFTGLGAGTYPITITDQNGCTNTITVTITEPPELIVSIQDDSICINETTVLTATVQGGSPGYNFEWNNGILEEWNNVNPGVTTSYSVTVTDINSCIANAYATVFVYPPLAINAYPDDTICEGEAATIYANYSGGMGEPYTLTLNGTTVIQTPYTVTPAVTTVYEVCVDDACPTPQACGDVEIVVMPDPPVNFVADIYEGCEPLTVHFNEINQHTGQTYLWDFGDPWGSTTGTGKNPVHTFENPGMYDITCTVTSLYGCTNTYIWYEMISVWPDPLAAFYPYPQVATILEPYVYFENNSSTFYITNWTFGDGDISNEIHPQHKYDSPGTYNVMLAVETEHGCVDTTWSEVVIQDVITFYAPTAFSPDFDQMNGLFSPVGHGIDPDHWHLMIYDRWGEKVWETYIYDVNEETGEVRHGWDGTIRNRGIGETATYSWLCIYRDVTGAEHERAGLVTLTR